MDNIDTTTWPECFITGVVPQDRPDAAICADALLAWSNCMAGNKRPEVFGDVMVEIGKRLGCGMLPDELIAHSERYTVKAGASEPS